jgi:succinylglutamic semialdehyde dehydrogenase
MSETISYLGDYINGAWSPVKKGDGVIKDLSPADLKDLVCEVPFLNENVDRAVEAAKKAFPAWARLSMDDRKKALLRLKEVFEAHVDEFAEVIARDTGKALWESKTEATGLAAKIDITLNHSIKLVQEERIPNALPGVEGVTRF